MLYVENRPSLFTNKPTNSGIMQEDLLDEEFSKLFRDILELTLTFMATLDCDITGLIGMPTTHKYGIYLESLLLVTFCTIPIIDN